MPETLMSEHLTRRRRTTKIVLWVVGALVVLFLIGQCSGSDDEKKSDAAPARVADSAQAKPTPSSKPTPKAPAVDWAARIKKFQREDLGGAAAGFDWWSEVKGVEYDDGLLSISTNIYPDSDAKPAAEPICGAYSTIKAEYPEVTDVWVLSSQRGKIASC